MTVPEPDLGPVPTLDSGLRPPEEFIPAVPFSSLDEEGEEFDEDPPAEEVTELSDEERLLFSQLMTVGQRSKTIDVFGFQVRIQNLCVDDDLRVGLYCKDFEGSQQAHRAFQLAWCAAAIRTVNSAPLVSSLAPMSPDEEFYAKIEVLKRYYPVVITQIYNAVMALDQEFAALAVKLGKLSG